MALPSLKADTFLASITHTVTTCSFANKLPLTSFGIAWLAFFQNVGILFLHDHTLNMPIHAVA